MRKIVCQTLILVFIACKTCTAQGIDSVTTNIENLPGNFFSKIQKKYTSLEKSLSKKTTKYLNKMQRQERRLQRKAAMSDSGFIPHENVDSVYAAFNAKLHAESSVSGQSVVHLNQYNPFIDTLSTSLAFLQKYKGLEDKVKLPSEALDKLKSKLNESDKIKEFIEQRKQQIKDQLSKYTHIPSSLKTQYASIQKTAYYYKAQIEEYKATLKDPKKIEEKALGVLNKMPFFQKFMKENSQLASLFGLPENYGTPASLAGLQTRASVQGMIQQRIAAGGPNALAQVQQNLQNAQAQLSQLKDKLLKSSGLQGMSGDIDMPDFKPNNQKTKPFLKRLDYGFNVQFEKNNSLMPSTSDLAGTLGYRLNTKSEAGIGISYKLGLGSIQHIQFSSQGIGFRSYLDWKIRKQFYATGGYEMNYNSGFKSIQQLKNEDLWQRSALAGISKKYQISKKLKGNLQLLYDFLAYRHTPVSQPFLFRIGYNF
ncbi:MAG: hypothetical protein ACTHOB_17385 [Ginsengibacter sp.]